MNLRDFFKLALTPPLPVVPSFAQQSSPEYTFTVAGLEISGHGFGGPVWNAAYLTVRREPAPVTAVPEPATSLLLFVGLAAVGAYVIWRSNR